MADETREKGVQAVAIALRILEFIAHSGRAVGVTELSRALDINKSRVYRHLRTLIDLRYLAQEADSERYRATARLLALGQAVSDNSDIAVHARPVMVGLREKFGHSVVLSAPDGPGVSILLTLQGTSNIEIGVKQGSVLSLHASAQGKIALAFGDESLLRELMQARLPSFTPDTITDPLRLAAELAEIRKRGWATAPNQAILGLNALSAPVFDSQGLYCASLAFVDSIQFIPDPPRPEVVEALGTAVRKLSAAIGHRPAEWRKD
jgi:IclR family KDG regulon transcriptional repressor